VNTRNRFATRNTRRIAAGFALVLSLAGSLAARPAQAQGPLIPNELSFSTVPSNGDVNPYGVAFVPAQYHAGGSLHPGDILVSNFNNSGNLQGTGTTIINLQADGTTSLFYQGVGLGLDAGLAILDHGFVIVGNVPTTDGTCATVGQGSLLILDLTVVPNAETPIVFVSNVLSGTITRINLQLTTTSVTVTGMKQIASGYTHACTAASFVLGPAGMAYDSVHDRLYVASTADNAIYAVNTATKRKNDGGKGALITADQVHLHGPIDLLLAPNGDLITANGDGFNADPNQPSEIVEFTTKGKFVSQFSINPNSVGGAFGIAIVPGPGKQFQLAAVDDVLSQLHLFTLNP
jgi:DNA-binding beta-propeller fold protein YncE